MGYSYNECLNKLAKLEKELAQLVEMTEEEACVWANGDSKAEAIDAWTFERDFFQSKVDEFEREYEEEDAEPTYGLDPAFRSWADVNRMFV